jgi:hypothetical protein
MATSTARRVHVAQLLAAAALATASTGTAQAAPLTPLPALPPTPVTTPLVKALASVTTVISQQCTTSALAKAPQLADACTAAAEQAGTDAYVYGIPLMEFMRQRRQQTSVTVPNSLSDAPVNQLGSARNLASVTPGHQVFVQPNNDTLYTMGHLDLSRGPIVLHVPKVQANRYYVFEFLDPYTNVFHYVGTRTTGNGAGDYAITGPGFSGSLPRGLKQISSPYNLAWLAGRTLVNGSSDLPAVHKVQDGYRLIPLAQYVRQGLRWHPRRPRRVVSTHTKATEPAGVAFFDQLGTALADNPPPAGDAAVLRELRSIRIGPGLHPSQEHLSTAVLKGLAMAADNGYSYLRTARTTYGAQSALAHHGWLVPAADTGDFGTDYQWRALVATFGLAANRPQEAIYVIGVVDQSMQLLNGSHDYVIHFPAGRLPPARYFWSLTMYDDQFFLVPNSINRYSIGNRTSGLELGPDGSLDVYVQHAPPAGHESNWLPAPASGTFEATLRMYGPLQSALDDSYRYPTIMRTR